MTSLSYNPPLDLEHTRKQFEKIRFKTLHEADIYVQESYREQWVLQEGRVKEASYQAAKGLGVRAVDHASTRFAYADAIHPEALEQSIQALMRMHDLGQFAQAHIQIPREKKEMSVLSIHPDLHMLSSTAPLYPAQHPLEGMSSEEKMNLLHTLDAHVRTLDTRISYVQISLAASFEHIAIWSDWDTWITDIRPLIRIQLQVLMKDGSRHESGSCGMGGRYHAHRLRSSLKQLAEDAVQQARINLQSKEAPAGIMPVVLGPGWSGILFHEAVGHGLEGDFNRKKTSVFHDQMNTVVASPICTVVDHGHLPDRRGSLHIDDEGTPTQENRLIERGVLKGYMQDRMNARLMHQSTTGNGRRQSYAHLPMPRMTNTYLESGDMKPEDIMRSVQKGIYAVQFGGGEVDITSGHFVFSVQEAYQIENGKVSHPLKNVTLIGRGSQVLKHISMVGCDGMLDHGVGTCGKNGQQVPVGVGQPTLKIDEMTVGGTA